MTDLIWIAAGGVAGFVVVAALCALAVWGWLLQRDEDGDR